MPPTRLGIADRLRVEANRRNAEGASFYSIAASAGLDASGKPRLHRRKLAEFLSGADVRASTIDAVAVAVGVRLALERSAPSIRPCLVSCLSL